MIATHAPASKTSTVQLEAMGSQAAQIGLMLLDIHVATVTALKPRCGSAMAPSMMQGTIRGRCMDNNDVDMLLTNSQAYSAMYEFILSYWKRSCESSNDIAELLNSMQIDEGFTNDPAFWDDWIDAIKSSRKQG